jgi:membrane carboxypeptidase/penicillin-binding protein
MVKAIRKTPPAPFIPPPGIVMTRVDAETGRAVCGAEHAINEAFRQGSQPPPCDSLIETPVVRDIAGWFRGLFH